MISNLNFNHLYYFYIVGRAQGLTEAARALRISQPSLSAQMKVLEARLGRSLFRKVGRRLVLTDDGHRVMAACREMFGLAESLERQLQSETQGSQVPLRFGVSADVERPFAVDVMSAAFGADPRYKIQFLSGGEAWLHREVQLGNFDFVLSTQPVYSEDFRILTEVDLPVVAGISKKLLPKNERPKNLRDLPPRWIAPAPAQRLRREADLFFEKRKMSPSICFESDVLGALIRAACDGIGWGLFPKCYLRHESRGKNLILLGPAQGFWKHRLYLMAPAHSAVSAEHGDRLAKALHDAAGTEESAGPRS